MSDESAQGICVIGRELYEQFKVASKSQIEFEIFFTEDPQVCGMEIIGYHLFDLMQKVNLASELAKGLGLNTGEMEIALYHEDIKTGLCIENARLMASIYFSAKISDQSD